MGIQGLLRELKSVTTQRHLKHYKGKTIAVDTYAWLHKIIKGTCWKQIYENKLSDRFVRECIGRIDTIRNFDINIIMVFDGGRLPSKIAEEENRQKKREESRQKAEQYIAKGDMELGMRKMAQSYDISPDVAHRLIVALRQRRIPFIVAPYEADAQLAYLSRNGIADVILTEDSDLLAFGARCVLYKLDYNSFIGEEIILEKIQLCSDPNLRQFNHCMFLSACILSGCDYLSQVRGVGVKSAFKLISRNKTGKRAIAQLRGTSKMVPSDYEQNFVKAFLTFRFQKVYCPIKRKCIGINDVDLVRYANQQKSLRNSLIDLEPNVEIIEWADEILDPYITDQIINKSRDFAFLGHSYDEETIQKIAEGFINPCTLSVYNPVQLKIVEQRKIKASKKSTQMKLTDVMKFTKTQTFEVRSNGETSFSQEFYELEEKKTIEIEPPRQSKPKLLLGSSEPQLASTQKTRHPPSFDQLLKSNLFDSCLSVPEINSWFV